MIIIILFWYTKKCKHSFNLCLISNNHNNYPCLFTTVVHHYSPTVFVFVGILFGFALSCNFFAGRNYLWPRIAGLLHTKRRYMIEKLRNYGDKIDKHQFDSSRLWIEAWGIEEYTNTSGEVTNTKNISVIEAIIYTRHLYCDYGGLHSKRVTQHFSST